ncbi:MAG: fibronectin type III domain-containing protein [Mogibacterium sp.]|nr:fibronectin type III domain-containing protein [Mogibacterium sp.]
MIRKRILSLAVTTAMLFSLSLSVAFADGEVKTWKELYEELIPSFTAAETEGYYDAVTTATKIGPNVHYQHIPEVVNKKVLEENPENAEKPKNVALDGVKSTVSPGTKEVKLGSATWETFKGKAIEKQYGSDELIVYPDDTVEDYVWSDYLMAIYAVTISDGTTTVGALPWIDFYGEKATAGTHYNKVEIALNSGKTVCGTDTLVKRFDDFYTGGVLNPGMYKVTIYADGYKTLTADIKVPTYTNATAEVADAEYGASDTTISFNNLPDDYDVALQLDGVDVALSGGKFAITGASIGSHTVTVKGKNDKYNSFTGTFNISTKTVPAKFDGSKLLAAEGVSSEMFASFIANISKVAVNGTEYMPRGRGRNIAKIVQEDGSLDFSKTDAASAEDKVTVVVTSTGFPEVQFESYASAEAKAKAEEKARAEEEARLRAETEEKARKEAEEKARKEAEEKARKEAEEKAKKEAEEKAKAEALEWNGTIDKGISAVKKLKVKAAKKSVKITWKKAAKKELKKFDKVEIQVCTDKKFDKANTKRVMVSKTKKSTTVKKLTKGKTYYVRVRNVKGTGVNKTVAKWSAVKKVKIKK